MKKYLLLTFLFLLSLSVSAQINYEEVADAPFIDFSNGSISFADIDSDGDQDVLMGGNDNQNDIAHLYINDGSGVFTERTNIPFQSLIYGACTFADIDNDSDLDILMAGDNTMSLYLNDGSGYFTEVQNTPFENVERFHEGTIDFADVDSDNDLDVLVTAICHYENSMFVCETKLYMNDGTGIFTESMNTNFEGVSDSSSDFADIDGDMDLDLVVCGENNAGQPTTKLYFNDGTGNYTEVGTTIFEQVMYGMSNFADVDNDGDYDLLVTGESQTTAVTKLYLNDGFGVYTETQGTTILGYNYGAGAFVDVDGDNDKDLFMAGYCEGLFSADLYVNNGSGLFSMVAGTPFVGVSDCNLAFGDLDGDLDPDLILAGFEDGTTNTNNGLSRTYLNMTNLFIQNLSLSQFRFFPNPTQGKLKVSNPSKIIIEKILIYDLNGKEIKTVKPDGSKSAYVLNVEGLRNGTYFVKLVSKQGTVSAQIIKK